MATPVRRSTPNSSLIIKTFGSCEFSPLARIAKVGEGEEWLACTFSEQAPQGIDPALDRRGLHLDAGLRGHDP